MTTAKAAGKHPVGCADKKTGKSAKKKEDKSIVTCFVGNISFNFDKETKRRRKIEDRKKAKEDMLKTYNIPRNYIMENATWPARPSYPKPKSSMPKPHSTPS